MVLLRTKRAHWPKAYFVFDGVAYSWSGWLGCQLESYEWLTVPAGTSRTLKFDYGELITITVFTTQREGFRVRTTWAVSCVGTHDEHVARIEDLRAKLKRLI